MGNASQSYGASPAIWDHTVLPDTGKRAPAMTPATQASTRFTDPGGWEAELTVVVGYTCPQTVTHPCTNQ